MSTVRFDSTTFAVLNELHHCRGENTSVTVQNLGTYKGWPKAKARRVLKSMTDSGLLIKTGKRGRGTVWTWTAHGIDTFYAVRKAEWEANPMSDEEIEAVLTREGITVVKCECGTIAKHLFNLVNLCGDCYAIATEPVGDQNKNFVDVRTVPTCGQCGTAQLTTGPCQRCLGKAEALAEAEARTFDSGKTYCSLCLDEVEPFSGDQGYTACCNKRMCEANEASENNRREIRYQKGETE